MAGDFSLRTSNPREREREEREGKESHGAFCNPILEVTFQSHCVLLAARCSVEGDDTRLSIRGVPGTILEAGYHTRG